MNWQFIMTDAWIMEVWHNYSIILSTTPLIIAALLKIIAIRHPGVPSDTINELVKIIFTRPGQTVPLAEKKEE